MTARILGRMMVLAAMIAGPAMAADMPLKAPPAPVYSWTGLYVGGSVGYSLGRGRGDYDDPNLGASGTGAVSYNSVSEKLDGIIGGGQIGYNWQVNRTWLLGFEADIQGSGERGNGSFVDPYSVGTDCDIYCSSVSGTITTAINWFGTVRGRVGVLTTPTMLLYVTGGLAYGRISASGRVTDAGCAGPPACLVGNITPAVSWAFANSATNVGWTLGGGVEGVVSNTANWTWKAEYLFLNLGSVSGTGFETGSDFGSLPYSWSTRVTDNILRVGLNYHFH